jgi:hypothetical protein
VDRGEELDYNPVPCQEVMAHWDRAIREELLLLIPQVVLTPPVVEEVLVEREDQV